MTETAAHLPLGLFTIITSSIRMFFSRFLLFFGIAVIPTVLMNLLTVYAMRPTIEAQINGQFLALGEIFTPLYFVISIGSLLIAFFIMGVTTLAAYDASLENPVRIRSNLARTMRALLPIVVLGIGFYLAVIVGMIFLLIPGIYVAARLFVFTPAILVEGAGFSALSRASELSQGYRWPIVVGLLFLALLFFLVSLVSEALFLPTEVDFSSLMGYGAINGLMSAVIYAISAIFTALLYARLREIKEGVGMRDLAAVFA